MESVSFGMSYSVGIGENSSKFYYRTIRKSTALASGTDWGEGWLLGGCECHLPAEAQGCSEPAVLGCLGQLGIIKNPILSVLLPFEKQ